MKVFITGIRGFLGSNLGRALEARGHQVCGSSRALGPPVFGDSDTIVYCASESEPDDAGKGRHRIFISSHSARPDAVSQYGISKYRIERSFLEIGETVVRPGLVIGAGGLFGRQLSMIRSARIIPLVDGGYDAIPVLAISDFREAMVNLIESGRRGVYNLFNERMPSMREIVETALRLDGRRALLAPIPFRLAWAGVWAAERLNIALPFSSESLGTLKLNRKCVHVSNLRELLSKETSVEAAIAYSVLPTQDYSWQADYSG